MIMMIILFFNLLVMIKNLMLFMLEFPLTNKKNDLQNQINNISDFCKLNNFIIDKTYSEISSGIDLDREQFNLLLNDVFKYKVDKIFISNKDRLTRLSFITLENIFKQFGTTI